MTAQVLRRYSSKPDVMPDAAADARSPPQRPLPAPTRLSLVAEYFALQSASAAPVTPPAKHAPPTATGYDSDGGPASTTTATTATSHAAPPPPPTAHRARRAHLRQRRILATLYPTHDALDAHLRARARHASRAVAIKATLAAHTLAMAKLTDAANLLLLAADHAALLLAASSAASPAASSVSSDGSSGESSPAASEAQRPAAGSGALAAAGLSASGSCVGTVLSGADALSRGARARRRASSAELLLAHKGCFPELGAPAPFRLRYLRRCWGLAGDALAGAVSLSTYLARAARRNARNELVPGVEARARRLGLARGRRELLTRVAAEARSARAAALAWHARQRRFVSKLRRELGRRRRAAGALDERVAQVRRELMTREFEARIVAGVPASA